MADSKLYVDTYGVFRDLPPLVHMLQIYYCDVARARVPIISQTSSLHLYPSLVICVPSFPAAFLFDV
jgi:hypothetical protein